MSTAPAAHPPAAPSEAAPLSERVRATLTSPGRLAALIRAYPRWVDALLLSTALAVVAAAFLPEERFLAEAAEAVTRRGEPVEITSSPAEIARWGRYLAMLSALAGHPLIAFALGGILMLLFGILGGSRASFREYLALASHALIIASLGTITALGLQHATGDPWASPSLGWLMPFGGPESAVGRFLTLVDVFTLWMVVVLGIGAAGLRRGGSAAATTLVLLGVYLAAVAGVAAWTG